MEDKRIHSYLVQRGKIEKIGEEYNNFSLNSLVNFDYMGSAEFEFGALPRSLDVITENFSKLKLHKTELKTPRNETIYAFCLPEDLQGVIGMVEYEKSSRHYGSTKEATRIEDQFSENPIFLLKTNFWWDIDYHFMVLLGDDKMAEAFQTAISNSVQSKLQYNALKTEKEQDDFINVSKEKSDKHKQELWAKVPSTRER